MNNLSNHFRSTKHKILWWARKFKKPYAAIRNGQRQERKGIRQMIISLAKFLLWTNKTFEKGQSKIFRFCNIYLGAVLILRRQPRGEGGQKNAYFTK